MAAAALHGTDIRRILTEAGPVVRCVLLRHLAPSGKDEHPSLAAAAAPAPADGAASSPSPSQHHRPVLAHMIEEIELDTTPAKSQVRHVLGGPWTFLGQYEEEGIVVMMRQPLPENDNESDSDDDDDEEEEAQGEDEAPQGKPKKDDASDILEALTVDQLRTICQDYFVPLPACDAEDIKDEKQQLVEALQQARENMASQVNPHRLQPPFDDVVVHGDLLLLRVAKTDEVLDKDEGNEEAEGNDENEPVKDLSVLSNDEFFQDYTKDEYIAFASRTDIVAPELPEHKDDDESEEDEDDEDEEDYELGDEDDEDFDAGEREGLLNLLMNELLRKFREENGRGPNTEELLELRSAVAEKLGVHVATVPHEKDEDNDKKRSADSDGSGTPSKKVKFSSLDENGDDEAAGEETDKNREDEAAEDATASKNE